MSPEKSTPIYHAYIGKDLFSDYEAPSLTSCLEQVLGFIKNTQKKLDENEMIEIYRIGKKRAEWVACLKVFPVLEEQRWVEGFIKEHGLEEDIEATA